MLSRCSLRRSIIASINEILDMIETAVICKM
jgi:hypothetical protein